MQVASNQVPLPAAPPPSIGAAACKKDYAVGTSIPANMDHAVSVSLPLWSDNIDYEEGRLSKSMETGYPRFFIHRSIQRLASLLCKKFAKPSEACILFLSARIAERCRDFMRAQSTSSAPLPIRIVRFSMLEHSAPNPTGNGQATSSSSTAEHVSDQLDGAHFQGSSTTAHYIFIVFFPEDVFPLAKSFWQHTGDGISSRQADRCLSLLEQSKSADTEAVTGEAAANESASAGAVGNDDIYKKPASSASAGKRFYNRYARTNSTGSALIPATPSPTSSVPQTPSSSGILQRPTTTTDDALSASVSSLSGVTSATTLTSEPGTSDLVTYVEERYGRNLPLTSAPSAKLALRRRIAGTLLSDRSEQSVLETPADAVGETGRHGTGVTEHDVYLFPSGMSAIFHAHQLALRAASRLGEDRQVGKSVCFGFPYTDTLKILQKFGPGCHFFGLGVDADLDRLEDLLKTERILALFCEFPSNPLLRSPNLVRIRQLADRYGFLVCVDETIGNFVNVEVLPFADVLVSSLTKVFSGDANVMGGSMVVNPKGPHYTVLKEELEEEYEDTYFAEDAIFMERNSRDFIRRIVRIDANTRAITSMLWSHRGRGGMKELFYPKFQTRENYDVCRRKKAFTPLGNMGDGEGGYGGLFSVTFESEAASKAFYDTLECAKGPSLGTNLTLASPYTILAHYGELDWAAQFGVERGLVRVSVGLEDEEFLVRMFGKSLEAAARAHAAVTKA
ncbi:Cys/Met metabolism, pyridoxal phosphate-dependent enzyme [Kalmanozyma brasiliensis GHG001]|uniref:cystathionine gamma-synthase n=1 Tax=Kalmanozyma brasiliensis (strain GHG001) TaxID=1365824 RepID=V5EIW6_KALBG|nr:Cys/Met metabolism, pyridoxal phosphate-dependent enzyme [Kalmanozyma brasiliensis GHG001]EST04635.1 Cys/Met metabolism, pyridoxal phosphate-dependent enzyme [Kalmanozyma brasiliensis GHG001]